VGDGIVGSESVTRLYITARGQAEVALDISGPAVARASGLRFFLGWPVARVLNYCRDRGWIVRGEGTSAPLPPASESSPSDETTDELEELLEKLREKAGYVSKENHSIVVDGHISSSDFRAVASILTRMATILESGGYGLQ
jgi:hypothetical protein